MQSHPQSRPCSAQADSVHWRTSSLHRPSSLYGNGFGNGLQLGSGRLGPEDVLDLELVNGADSDQTHLPPGCQWLQCPSRTLSKDRRTGASSASPTMPYLDTTTSASSPVEGPGCESHIMAPAVCILNPSNGTHNCRPGWRTCLGSTPSGSVPLYACACLNLRAAPRRRKFKYIPCI